MRAGFLAWLLVTACSEGRQSPPPDAEQPERIVTLSPHLAELVFATGAGDLLVGVSAYTDFPREAALLPVVGDAFNLDLEQLALLQPDLLLAWETGTPCSPWRAGPACMSLSATTREGPFEPTPALTAS